MLNVFSIQFVRKEEEKKSLTYYCFSSRSKKVDIEFTSQEKRSRKVKLKSSFKLVQMKMCLKCQSNFNVKVTISV